MLVESDQRPARTIGRYALFAEIASGGMASIHIGRLLGPVGFSRTVAIKRLHPQFARDPEFVTMFLDEARLAARIRHPNVAPTLDVVATQGELFLVMEYIQGESLAQLVRNTQAAGEFIPQEIVRSIMSGVLHGLHAAHEAKNERGEPLGIVHRDVSPQNILVGTDGIARLLDFGIAKAAGRCHVTRDRHVKGKLSYMAPEQIENIGVDRRVDVYAAAVVLWELLTGQRLFDADSDSSKLVQVLTSVVTRPSAIVPGISASLDRLVLRGMNRNPKHRYDSARELALALESSGKMATPSAVGAWVESVAHKELAERAAHIAAVELLDEIPSGVGSAQLPVLSVDTAVNDQPTVIGPATGVEFVEDSSIDLVPAKTNTSTKSEQLLREPASHKRRRLGVAVVGLGAILALGLFGLRSCGSATKNPVVAHRAPAAASAQAPNTTAASLARPSELTASVDATMVEASRESDGAVAMGGIRQADPTAKLRTNAQRTAATPTKSKAVDCNPPFTLDATGIRHYKRNCL